MTSKRVEGSEEEAGAMAVEAQQTDKLPERWSARQKTEIVLRLLKGEELGTVSRETQVPVHELERWRRIFLEGAANRLKRRDTVGAQRELRARAGEGGSADDEGQPQGNVPERRSPRRSR